MSARFLTSERKHIFCHWPGVMEPAGSATIVLKIQEAVMTHWHDKMVEQPETDGAVYVTGWTISGLAVIAAILAVWVFGV
jgi:hypothetical protein